MTFVERLKSDYPGVAKDALLALRPQVTRRMNFTTCTLHAWLRSQSGGHDDYIYYEPAPRAMTAEEHPGATELLATGHA